MPSRQSLDPSKVSFIPHEGLGKFQSYLALNLSYHTVNKLREKIEGKLGLKLITRGEAHITVLTPPEYEKIGEHLSIQEINLFFASSIQNSNFEITCLGRGKSLLDGKEEFTFFVVTSSEDLLEIRRDVYSRYLDLGGREGAFNPEEFYPHITVGFTKRDLHFSDGVIKDRSSCLL